MKIAIFGKTFSKDFTDNITSLFDKLHEHQASILLHRDFADFLINERGINPENCEYFGQREELPSDVNFLFSLGGDGTFLEAVTMVRQLGIPILGINTGRLGFLANISRDEISEAMDELFSGNYVLEDRALIRMNTSEGPLDEFNTALNEVTIHKKNVSMITVRTELNGEYLNSYWADGLIISTSTGSTAYSMSVGGPIMLPQTRNFIISPVAPHNLTVRPMVVPDDMQIRLKIISRSEEFLVALDSRSFSVKTNVQLILDKAPYTIKMVKFAANNFYNTLRNKLMWGMDRRN